MEAVVIDFGNLPFKKADGTTDYKKDFNQDLGNKMHFTATTVDDLKLGDYIFNNPQVEITKDNAATIKKYMISLQFFAFINMAVIPYCNKVLGITDDEWGLPDDTSTTKESTDSTESTNGTDNTNTTENTEGAV